MLAVKVKVTRRFVERFGGCPPIVVFGAALGLGGPGPPGCTGSCVSVAEPETDGLTVRSVAVIVEAPAAPDADDPGAVGAVFVVDRRADDLAGVGG